MKNYTFIFLLTYATFHFSSCREVGPPISVIPNDTSSAAQKKMVLVELETGDQCVNCPQGIAVVDQLADTTYPQQVAIIELHDGFLSNPYSFSPQNLQSSAAASVDNILGPAEAKPAASVDRFFKGQYGYFDISSDDWGGDVQSRLLDTLKVNIFISTPAFNPLTRQLSVSILVKYIDNVTTSNNLNVAITESGITDPQSNLTVIDTYYVHNNVLRALMTPVTGDPISGTLNAGYEVTKTYTYTLPALWNAANCNIVAFVTNSTESDIEVLQTQEIRLY
jgi:hypothetical protein